MAVALFQQHEAQHTYTMRRRDAGSVPELSGGNPCAVSAPRARRDNDPADRPTA
jgi:hypothetical protein